MSNEKIPFTWDKKKVLALLLLVLILGLVVLYRGSRVETIESIPSATEDNPKFVLAEWDYPDEYGQGIYAFSFWENSTGSWVAAPWYTHYYPDYHEEEGEFYFLQSDQDYRLNWSEGVAMKIRVFTTFNNTVIGAIDEADGQNYQRHSINVTASGLGITKVFSQQNFTYFDVSVGWPFVQYEYEVILEFLPLAMTIYTITIDYEVFTQLVEETEVAVSGSHKIVTGGTYANTQASDDSYYWLENTIAGATYNAWFKLNFSVDTELVFINFTIEYSFLELYATTPTFESGGISIYNFDTSSWFAIYNDVDWHAGDVSRELSGDPAYVDTGGSVWLCVNLTMTGDAGGDQYGIYVDFAELELGTSLDWNMLSTASLLFEVSFDEWGYNVALVILGLCMIPGSTLYLAYGIKNDRTSDRLFYGLIIFFMGFGLLIAGITP